LFPDVLLRYVSYAASVVHSVTYHSLDSCLVVAPVLTQLDYCNAVLAGLPAYQLNRLKGAFTQTRVRVRVPVYGFQQTRVCMYFNDGRWPWYSYQYRLPVNFTHTSSFGAGRVFIQPESSKQHKICINIIYTGHYAHLTS